MRFPTRCTRIFAAPFHRALLCGALASVLAAAAWHGPERNALAEAGADDASGVALPWRLAARLEYGPLERDLFEARESNRLSDSDLLPAALVASGVANVATYEEWHERWRAMAAKLKQHLSSDLKGQPLAAAVFQLMHQELLTGGYDIHCSDVTSALQTGKFNCISATLLYNCLCAEFGLRTCAAETPGHVFSLVLLDDRRLEVETTCPAWFEILNDPARLAAFAPPVGDSTQAAVESSADTPFEDSGRATRQAIRRELGTAELAAIVYYNRGVDFVERRQFADAVACNYKALQLDGANSVARGNLLAAINNWSLAEAEQGRFEESLQILRAGRQIAPNHATFAVNFVALHQQWADALVARDRYREAGDVLQLAAKEAPNQPQLDASRFLIYRQWGERLARAQRYEEMFALFAEGRRREPSLVVQWNQAEIVAVRNAALHLAHSGRAKTALWLIEQAEAKHPRNLALAKTRNEILRQRAAA